MNNLLLKELFNNEDSYEIFELDENVMNSNDHKDHLMSA